MFLKRFGKLPSGKHLERIQQSPNYKDNAFKNKSKTDMLSPDSSYLKILKDQFTKTKLVTPSQPIPFVRTNLKETKPDQPTIIWFGHSSYLIYINGKTILVDPVFSGNAAPFSFMVKAYKGANEYQVNDFPEIDVLLLTHDHYDHLDYKTVLAFQPKVKQIYCSLGLASHLKHWGFDSSKITEFDWWDTHSVDSTITITSAPARHFTGRGITRAKTLWSSFILKTNEYNLYLGGDSGYDDHFKIIGEKYGPFDLAILESGQYNTSWPYIHMMPEQTVHASIDLKAKVLLPVHWSKFTLALHPWNEPIERIIKKAAELNVKVTTPMIGEPVIINQTYPNNVWWNFQ